MHACKENELRAVGLLPTHPLIKLSDRSTEWYKKWAAANFDNDRLY